MAFSDEQRQNAAVIISVGRSLGASDRDLQIALMTALQESGLRNLSYGDRDSVGLFQQRDAWAPYASRMNPYESAKMFFTGGQQGQRGLLDFKTRDKMSLTQAAQAVQVSAFPDAYAKHESAATELLGLTGYMPDAPAGAPAGGVAPAPGAPAGAPGTLPKPALTPPPAAPSAPPGPDVTAGLTPGTGAVTAPGVGPVAPGSGEVTAPGVGSVTEPLVFDDPAEELLDEPSFTALFPDAQQTALFSGALTTATGGRRADVVSAAMSWVGTPYAWGGTSRDGADCSGSLQSIYAQFGIDLPRISAEQARFGARIGLNALQPGDLVAWDNSTRNNGADHIAMYLGDGRIFELPRPGLAGRIRALDDDDSDAWGVSIAQLG